MAEQVQAPAVTPAEVRTAFEVTKLVLDCIREAGEEGMPSGILYANLMGYVSIDAYQSIIRTLKKTGLVRESGHVLYFVEEALTPKK